VKKRCHENYFPSKQFIDALFVIRRCSIIQRHDYNFFSRAQLDVGHEENVLVNAPRIALMQHQKAITAYTAREREYYRVVNFSFDRTVEKKEKAFLITARRGIYLSLLGSSVCVCVRRRPHPWKVEPSSFGALCVRKNPAEGR
jgi:hypothetical protein